MKNTTLPPALLALAEAGIPARRMDYEYVLRGGTNDAAIKLGVSEHAVVKSIVFDNGKSDDELRGVIVLMHGDERISIRKLERLAAMRHLRPSPPDVAEALTGFQPGGICPFRTRTVLPVFLQETLLLLPEIYINAGERGVVAAIAPSALLMLHPVQGDIRSIQA